MAKLTKEQFVEALKEMTILEIKELVDGLKEEFGIDPTACLLYTSIPQFVQQFNERTKDQMGYIVPVVISVYEDRTFSFVTKTPPASDLIKKAAGINKGSGSPHADKVDVYKRQDDRVNL